LTYRCPLKCLYCSNPLDFAKSSSELSTEEWKQIFTEAADLGIVQLHFSGGEPTLREDLAELVQHANSLGCYTNLITGGTLLNEARLRAYAKAGLKHVQLSLQGATRETSESVAGIRSYARKIKAALMITAAGFPLTLNVVLHRLNLHEIPELIEMALQLGAIRLELANTQFYGWGKLNEGTLMPSSSAYGQAIEMVLEIIPRYQERMQIVFVPNDYLNGNAKACMGGWGRSYMCINPAGEVLPCHAAKVIPGLHFDRVRKGELRNIWRQSVAMNMFRGDAWMREPCRSCAKKNIDFGGCRCQAFMISGDAAETDPACSLSTLHQLLNSHPESEGLNDLIYRTFRNSRRFK
jgi:pyrroloquinoline quinone biosynthesis protein E